MECLLALKKIIRSVTTMSIRKFTLFFLASILLFTPHLSFAASSSEIGDAHFSTVLLLLFAVLLIAGKIGGIVEKIGLPSVLGELTAGIFLSGLAFAGVGALRDVTSQQVFVFLAELGAILLLFKIGLESNLSKLTKVGTNALLVAVAGVVAPFVVGAYIIGPMLFPEASNVALMFIGASLVATSVGITASVFSDLKILSLKPCQTVLGAAVIDDVLGLFVLAIVSAIAEQGSVEPIFLLTLTIKAFGFLALAIALGNIFANSISQLFSKISTGTGMKLSIAICFALIYAYIASLAGLAPIIGAFCAGLVLDAVHFKKFTKPAFAKDLMSIKGLDNNEKEKIEHVIEKHSETHVEELVDTVGYVLVPVFFVFTGLQIDFATLLNPSLYLYALILGIAAVLTKLVAGFMVKGNIYERLLIGVSMVPRGEVGLIFAAVGKSFNVLNAEMFSVVVMVIIFTTFIAPPFITYFARKMRENEEAISFKSSARYL